MDYRKLRKTEAIPEASSLIETFRAVGYSLETAIADIVDNAISAHAKKIYITRIWRGGQSVITIKDDGHGMSGDEIVQAMRPGVQHPLSERLDTDLGRFGLGLKTASFSQCRKLSVLSKRKGSTPSFWSWDLDYVNQSNKWELISWMPEEYITELDDLLSGTLIVWSDLDRVLSLRTVETDENAKQKFSYLLDRVKKHIAMTFHRFIEDKNITLYWGEHEIEAWNPFCINESKTQPQPDENISGGITMKGYVLPHKNNFSTENEYKKSEGVYGYPAMQGFYVYRGKRLLLSGDWLGLFRKEEQCKLVRIQLDLPNKLDTEWQIDIKKSKATPPANCREQLEAYAKSIRNIGIEVYKHRGKILKQRAGQDFQPLWLEKKKDNIWSFIVNREHLMIQHLINQAREKPDQAIETLLQFIEESLPTSAIYIKKAEDKEEQEKTPFSDIDTKAIIQLLIQLYSSLLEKGNTVEQSKAMLRTIEPFNYYSELIEDLK